MTLTKTHKMIISAVAVLILLGIYIAFDRNSEEKEKLSDLVENIIATSTDSKTTTQNTGSYTIEQVPINETSVPKPIPNLNRPVIVSSKAMVTTEATTAATPNIKLLQARLKNNPSDFNSWINLGINQKEAGDYDGAVISWKYASKLAPSDYISLGNLGNMYAYFLKDNAQAEVYYRQAISKGPTQAYLYVQLIEVYRDVFKDLEKARDMVSQGLSKIPNDPNLLQLQASLK